MKLYLLNALITPFDTEISESAFFAVKKVSKNEYEEIFRIALKQKFEVVSVIGHESTVEFMKLILSDDLRDYVKYARTEINLDEGDLALVIRVKVRGDHIREHSLEDLKDYYSADKLEFLTLSRIYNPELVFKPIVVAGGEND